MGLVNGNYLLLAHGNTRCSYGMLRLVHGNNIVINTYEMPVYSQHVTVVAWRLYHLHNFKLQACYNTLPNRDYEYGVLYYRNYPLQICFLTSFI